jgi:3' exoribonuclease, RNase T-like
MNHAMIDLETLSTRFDAAIISIGVAIFDDNMIVDTAGWALDPKSVHGHIDPKTVMWWMGQEDAAREFSFTGKFLASTAGFELKTLLAKHDVKEVWSKDPHFDHVILQSWWERVGTAEHYNLGEFPYHYRAPRSFRTLEAEALRAGFTNAEWEEWNFVAHNPVDDAVTQARAVIKMRKLMGSRQS